MVSSLHAESAQAKSEQEHAVIDYAQSLVRFRSVTPHSAGAIEWLIDALTERGFHCHEFAVQGVTNLVAHIQFGEGPCLGFSGHIDVVPAQAQRWCSDPFAAHIVDGEIIGRGIADMKGGVAAMLAATDELLATDPKCGTFYWLITSDEEGEAMYGSAEIAKYLAQQQVILDACIVGEPTSDTVIGDTVKNGRRGALSGTIRIEGKAGHVAYPDKSLNAAHIAMNIGTSLTSIDWQRDQASSKTSLQITGIEVPNSVDNIVPALCLVNFNVRYSHGYNSEDIKQHIVEAMGQNAAYCDVTWQRPCEPYYTKGAQAGQFDVLNELESAIYYCTKSYPKLCTFGGTSDGRFFAVGDTQVVECGLRNFSIHQDNERAKLSELKELSHIYSRLLTQVFIG